MDIEMATLSRFIKKKNLDCSETNILKKASYIIDIIFACYHFVSAFSNTFTFFTDAFLYILTAYNVDTSFFRT